MPTMKLDQFLKWQGLVATGGEAKQLITAGRVMVNGSVELRRGRKLTKGDEVSMDDGLQLFFNDEPPGSTLTNFQ